MAFAERWPSNYDVRNVPPVSFTPQPPQNGAKRVCTKERLEIELYWSDGKAVIGETYYDDVASRLFYVDGRRKQAYWADGTPASSYNADGSQIPLFRSYGSEITNYDPDPLFAELNKPEPEPEPGGSEGGDTPTTPGVDGPAGWLMQFMADPTLDPATATTAWETAVAVCAAYTRDRHLGSDGNLRADVKAVVLTVAARIAANPGQIMYRDSAGSFNRTRGVGYQGLTLTEQMILNRYRKRAIGP